MKLSRLLAGTALALSLGMGSAMAAPIFGDVSIDVDKTTFLDADKSKGLSFGDTVTFTGLTFTSPSKGDFKAFEGKNLSDTSITLTLLSSAANFSFTSSVGDFAGKISELTVASRFANIVVNGTFTPKGSGLDPNKDVVLTISVNRAGDGISSGIALEAPEPDRIEVPEPMSLALFGMGLAGLGVAMRRRV